MSARPYIDFRYRHDTITTPNTGNAAARRKELQTDTGQLLVYCSDQDVFVLFGDDTVDADGSGSDEGLVPSGTPVNVSTKGLTHVSVYASADGDVILQEVSA